MRRTIISSLCMAAAGMRNGSDVSLTGMMGNYWSNTLKDNEFSYLMNFYSAFISPSGSFPRNAGLSVRLVSDIPAVE